MIDLVIARRRAGQAALAAAALALVLLLVVPLPGAFEARLPGPDILLCLVLAWVARRPDEAPAWLIGLIGLFADFMLMRPPGLGAALWVLAGESLRGRRPEGAPTFLAEWALAAGAIVAVLVAEAALRALFQVPQAGAGSTAARVLFTALAYPLVVGVARQLLGLRRAVRTPRPEPERGGRLAR